MKKRRENGSSGWVCGLKLVVGHGGTIQTNEEERRETEGNGNDESVSRRDFECGCPDCSFGERLCHSKMNFSLSSDAAA